MARMKTVTKENLLQLIALKKEHAEKKEDGIKDADLLQQINSFIDDVINRDKRYYRKLQSYDFTSDQLRYLL